MKGVGNLADGAGQQAFNLADFRIQGLAVAFQRLGSRAQFRYWQVRDLSGLSGWRNLPRDEPEQHAEAAQQTDADDQPGWQLQPQQQGRQQPGQGLQQQVLRGKGLWDSGALHVNSLDG